MNTNTLAAALIGFLLGGLLVSTAAALDDDGVSRVRLCGRTIESVLKES